MAEALTAANQDFSHGLSLNCCVAHLASGTMGMTPVLGMPCECHCPILGREGGLLTFKYTFGAKCSEPWWIGAY